MLYLLVYHSSDSLVVALLVESRLATSFFLQPDHEIGYASLPVVPDAEALAPSTSSAQAQAQCCSHQILGGQVIGGSACVSTQQLGGSGGMHSKNVWNLEVMILLLRAFLGQNRCFLEARRQFHMHEYISCSSHCQVLVLVSRLFTHLASPTLQDVACETSHSLRGRVGRDHYLHHLTNFSISHSNVYCLGVHQTVIIGDTK